MKPLARRLLTAARSAWFMQRKRGLRQRIRRCLGLSQDQDIQDILTYVANHPELELPLGMTPPYEWVNEYSSSKVLVEKEDSSGLLYVIINNHRVYFPRNATLENVQDSVSIGLMEQDLRSPHRYVGDGFNVDAGDIGVFIGASDGLFCLSLLDRLSKAYLFEPNEDWHEPLRATFASWGDKVEIVPLAVGSRNDAKQVSLDYFFANRPVPQYIQVDVDGLESDILKSGQRLLKNVTKLRLSLCTYHKRLDFPRFSEWLGNRGFTIAHSPGFYFLGVRKPFFRRGILYATKTPHE